MIVCILYHSASISSHVTHMNESCHTYEWVVVSHIWMSRRVTHMNESCHTYEWVVVSHIWMSRRVTHMNESSCHTYEWVIVSHIWMSHVTHTNRVIYTIWSLYTYTMESMFKIQSDIYIYTYISIHVQRRHVPRFNGVYTQWSLYTKCLYTNTVESNGVYIHTQWSLYTKLSLFTCMGGVAMIGRLLKNISLFCRI